MAYHIQSSFSGGELDPALHERTTFDKYQTGLKTLRNAVVGKTGRITSRPGTTLLKATKVVTLASGTFTAAVTDICTKTAHNFGLGEKVRLTNSGGTLPAGLSLATDYFVAPINADTFYLFTTYARAMQYANVSLVNTFIDITGTGTGTHTIVPQNPGTKRCFLYSPPFTRYIIEAGHGYVRIHDIVVGNYVESPWNYMDEDLDFMQMAQVGKHVFFSRYGKPITQMVLGDLDSAIANLAARFVPPTLMFFQLTAPTIATTTPVATGYLVEYQFTYVANGQESNLVASSTTLNLPIAISELNTFTFTIPTLPTGYTVTEIRAYRRPKNGSAFGYIGNAEGSGGTFIDYGQDADYTHSPPTMEAKFTTGDGSDNFPYWRQGRCIAYYQQRLIMTESYNDPALALTYAGDIEAIRTSRVGYTHNFFRDYPLQADSSLSFKAGTTGRAEVIRLQDYDGLMVFTTIGIYQSRGPLGPQNLFLDRKGNWVIEEKVPPLEIPGGILFVDKSTNTIRTLIFSNEAGGYPGEEVSVFSNHLFLNKKIVSWAYQEGDIPLIWAVMDDGTINILTYQREQQMRGWSHHDTEDGLYESVTVVKDLTNKSVVYALVNRSGTRYIEYFGDRFVEDTKDYIATDSTVTFKSELSADGVVSIVVTKNATDWDESLTLTADAAIFANTTDNGAVGTVFRFFDSEGSAVDFTVTTFTSTSVLVVTPSCLFPSAEATGIKLYKTYSVLTGLSHLNGISVSLLVDGYVESSPNNNIENYTALTPSGGSLTIPKSRRGAIVHVGIPFTVDVQTLDIDTVEQKPTLLESKLVHKVFVKVYNTRGIYVGTKFPTDNKVDGLVDPEEKTEDILLGNIGNAAQALTTKRHDIVIRNDWSLSGSICIRQVDPLPVEILSIIPDMSILY